MRHILLGSVGTAALLASTGLAVAAPAFDWSGFYAGFALGGLRTHTAEDYYNTGVFSFEVDQTFSGLTGIVDGGYDWQSGNFVLGISGDLGITNATGTNSDGSVSVSPFGTIRARAGVVAGKALIYGTAGLAFAKIDIDNPGATGFDSSGIQKGLVAGAGVEFALTDKLTLNVEARYTDYGVLVPFDSGTDRYTTSTNSTIGLVGLQFHM